MAPELEAQVEPRSGWLAATITPNTNTYLSLMNAELQPAQRCRTPIESDSRLVAPAQLVARQRVTASSLADTVNTPHTMAAEDPSSHLAESGITMHSDSEQYSPGEELSTSPASSGSPIILYKPPTAWSLIRGVAINLLLPFINGMMLGFGELFAHEAAFRLGWGGTKVFPMSRRRAHAIGPGIEVRERRQSPGPSLDDLASLE
ncbi:hypothetical protein QQS21_007242 [Conoideocrella luteorostrata]|uniref:Outer membrane protein Tom13 n=1 Tax=Conoideocrella luteorostrata TaxID=1105319 RepID=A0AAJ0CLY3_9HYPO|nr:hypothetical protein QQS21_007242 [Conoideocrella luteorostrata]